MIEVINSSLKESFYQMLYWVEIFNILIIILFIGYYSFYFRKVVFKHLKTNKGIYLLLIVILTFSYLYNLYFINPYFMEIDKAVVKSESTEVAIDAIKANYLAVYHSYPLGIWQQDGPFYSAVLSAGLSLSKIYMKKDIILYPDGKTNLIDIELNKLMQFVSFFSRILGIFVLISIFILLQLIFNKKILSLIAVLIASTHPLFNIFFLYGYVNLFSVLIVNVVLISFMIYIQENRIIDSLFLFGLMAITPQINFVEYILLPLTLVLIVIKLKNDIFRKHNIINLILGLLLFTIISFPFVLLQLFLTSVPLVALSLPSEKYANYDMFSPNSSILKVIDNEQPENSLVCVLSKWYCRAYFFENMINVDPPRGVFPIINKYRGNLLKYFMYLSFGTENIISPGAKNLENNKSGVDFSKLLTWIYLVYFIVFLIGVAILLKKRPFFCILFIMLWLSFIVIYSPYYASEKIWMANTVFNGMIPLISAGVYWIIKKKLIVQYNN